jgi:basic membrane protein A
MQTSKKYSITAAVVLVAILIASCATPTPEVIEVEVVKEVPVEVIKEVEVEVPAEGPSKLDNTPRLAVVSAFGAELELLLAETEVEETYVILGHTFTTGKLRSNDVVLLLSGVSIVNAAMNMQVALDNFNITHIVYSGIAGGVNPNLDIGDVTVAKQWGLYQKALFARETDEGWNIGWHDAPFGNYGMSFPQYVSVFSVSGTTDETESLFWFEVDEEMLAIAEAVSASVDLEDCAPDGCLDDDPIVKVGGNGVSGPTFVDNADYRSWVWETFQADALDMETAAVALVAYANDVPYIAFRSLSDLAGGGPGENLINVFFGLAADNSAKVLLAFLEAWATGEEPAPQPTPTPAPPEPTPEPETLLACFMFVGPIGDHGWTYAHDQGRLYLEENVANVETLYYESVSDVDAEARLRDMVEIEGCDIIFTTSFSFRDATAVVAPEYPDVIFENCSGFLTDANMGSYFGRMYQGKFLAGIVGGLTTKSNKIGYVAPIKIPEIIRLINGVTLGARSVNPDVEMSVMWIDNWFDVPAETAAVNAMVDGGVDVIFTGTDTTIPVKTANERGVYSVGYDSCESCDAAPDLCLTTPCWHWGPTYAARVEAVRDGTWKPEATYEAMADGIVILTELGPAAPDDAQLAVDLAYAAIQGDWDVFCGPIYDNHGELRVADGECMTDEDLLHFNWYVEGVASEVPPGVGGE